MSNIAIIGATGRAGSQLLEEALRRSHSVTAIARNTAKIGQRAGVVARNVDALDASALQAAIEGHDVVISAAHFATLPASGEGRSWIAFADYAIAMLDEVEVPEHSRQRFTVGY